MRIFKHLRSDWFRYGFALESWGEVQKVKREEHEILVDLLNDLNDSKQQSTAFIHSEMHSKRYSILALNQSTLGDSLPPGFYSDSFFIDFLWNVEMEVPVINSYSDIKNTGKTSQVDDRLQKCFGC